MSLDATTESHLRQALHLAEEASALASPNPTVGCVLFLGDRVLGQGAHLYDLFDHAEIVALKQAAALGHNVHGATACVTLEPCAHHGRTPPCSDALIAAGISRCVIATVDPNPLVRGQGIAKLRAAGIDVDVLDPASPLAQHARTLNNAFAFAIQYGRPFVTLKAAVSADGFLAPPPSTRSTTAPHWLTGTAARADVQQLRHASDAILTGIGTILADNPSLTDRTNLPRRRALLRVILDSRLRTPLDASVTDTVHGDLLFIVSNQASSEDQSLFEKMGAEVITIPTDATDRLDLHAALSILHRRDIRSVLLEAGSELNGAFLKANLVDRVILYHSEFELGPGSVPFAKDGPSPSELEQHLTTVKEIAIPHSQQSTHEDTRLTGYLHNPWNGIEDSGIQL